MTQPREIEQVLDTWFRDGPRELADRALTDALSEIDHTRQLGAHVVPWRYSEMPTPVRLLLVAALMAISAGAALLISAGARNSEPTPSPSPVELGPGEPIGNDPAGQWVADRPRVFGALAGEYTLNIVAGGEYLIAWGGDGQDILLGWIYSEGEGRTGLGATDHCPDEGHYSHEVSADGRTFTITVVGDPCEDRATLLAGEWRRTSIARQVSPRSRYRVDFDGATVDVTVPASFVSTSGDLTTFTASANPLWSASFRTGVWEFSLGAGAPNGYSATDRCQDLGDAGHRSRPTTIDEYLAWNESSRGLEVSAPARLQVAGHPAVRVDLAGGIECQAAAEVRSTEFVEGQQTREWAIDIGSGLLLAEVANEDRMGRLSPELVAAGDAFVQSMEIAPKP